MHPSTHPWIRRTPWSAAVALALLAGCWRSSSERAGEGIADRNAEARGGVTAWRRIEAMTLSGTLEAGKRRDPVKLAHAYARPEGQARAEARRALAQPPPAAAAEKQVRLPFVLELKRPRKTRLEVRFQGQTAVQVYDGTKGWKLRPFLGRREVEPYGPEELRLAAQQADLDGPLVDWAEKGATVKLLGKEAVDGREAYELEVRSRSGEIRHVWVDAKTFLDVKVDGTRNLGGKVRTVWTWLRDWRSVGGVMVPHLLETAVDGVPGSERITVEHVAVNPNLADARFARPD